MVATQCLFQLQGDTLIYSLFFNLDHLQVKLSA